MPLAARSSGSCAKLQTTRSTWTPLNHPQSNSKVFEERRKLLAKWFARWSDSQRRAVLQDLLQSCSSEQLLFLSLSLSRQLPLQAADFSCLLPRALCLYIFSFLDPRSLCRCARVSWHWKSMVELDQLWMPKCLRLGWSIGFSPTPFETGLWKRHYIHMVQQLRLNSVQSVASRQQTTSPHAAAPGSKPEDASASASLMVEQRPSSSSPQTAGSTSRRKPPKTPPPLPPWRDSDRRPKDTLRFNYLDNLDPSEQGLRAASGCRSSSRTPGDSSQKTLSEAHYKLRKAKSLMFLNSSCRLQHPPPPLPPPPHHHHDDPESRPAWAEARGQDCSVSMETTEGLLLQLHRGAQWNAGLRPGPIRAAVPQLSSAALRASQRSQRSAPSKPLFQHQPWTSVVSPMPDMD